MEKYEFIREIALGSYSVAKLMRYRETNELVAMKFIPRGDKINENVAREILNHRSLQHPNIVRFKEVVLTPTHLAIVMEYAAGGELFHRITTRGAFSEDEARYFFRQIISGISYCHSMQICHRDLKLENTLLDGTLSLRLKICDFGFSKSYLHSRPRSMVGSPAYVAPEVFLKQEYDGKLADVWSCGVILYVMLVGTYPFEDPNDPKNLRNSVERTLAGVYQIPKKMAMTHDCKHLLSQIFVTDPTKRITMDGIKKHPWFLNNSSRVWAEKALYEKRDSPVTTPLQSVDEISKIVEEARIAPVSSFPDHGYSDEELKDKEAEGDNGKQEESKGLSQCGPVETTKLVDQAIVKIKKTGLVETKLVDQAIAERKKTGPVETTKLVDQAVVERKKKCAIRRNASR